MATFKANASPAAGEIIALARATPYTPFNSPEYAAARAALGETICVLALTDGPVVVSGCLGFMKGGALSRRLEIVTAPSLPHPMPFWDGVRDFCRREGVWEVIAGTFGSEPGGIPPQPGEFERRTRCEFVLDLDAPDLLKKMSKGHRYNIKRAQKGLLVARRTRDPGSSATHLALMQASTERRITRGEDVSLPRKTRLYEALLAHNAAELFQLMDGEAVVSSMLVVWSGNSAYYHTGGTSPEGMNKGAATFLIAEVARMLQADGVRLFNLGGVDLKNTGLLQFKTGFGARKVMLEAVSFSTVSPVKWKLRSAARSLNSKIRGSGAAS